MNFGQKMIDAKMPYRTEEKPVDNYTDIEIKRAEIHEREKTKREKLRQREQTRRSMFRGRTEGFYIIRFCALAASLGGMGLSWGMLSTYLDGRVPADQRPCIDTQHTSTSDCEHPRQRMLRGYGIVYCICEGHPNPLAPVKVGE